MLEYRSRRISLEEISVTYIPFAIVFTVAMMAAELSDTLVATRGTYAIWLATLFVIPAFSLYITAGSKKFAQNVWKLCWTFSFLAYLIHFYYMVYLHYGGIAEAYTGQGASVAIPNFLLTFWWAMDIALVWLYRRDTMFIMIERFLLHVFAMVLFFVASVILVGGTVSQWLGILMLIAIITSTVFRIRRAFTG